MVGRIGGGGGKGGKLYMAARVAMLGETATTSDEEGHESSEEPLVDSSSESQGRKDSRGTGWRGGEARSGW